MKVPVTPVTLGAPLYAISRGLYNKEFSTTTRVLSIQTRATRLPKQQCVNKKKFEIQLFNLDNNTLNINLLTFYFIYIF